MSEVLFCMSIHLIFLFVLRNLYVICFAFADCLAKLEMCDGCAGALRALGRGRVRY